MLSEEKIKLLFQNHKKEDAFELLVYESQKDLLNLIYKIIKNVDDSKDILQNSYINVYNNIDKFRFESKLSTWLYRIAVNESINYKKTKYNKKIVDFEIISSAYSNIDDESEKQIILKFENALKLISGKQKEVFLLRYYQDLKFSEIANILGKSESTIKTNYNIAKNKILKYLLEN